MNRKSGGLQFPTLKTQVADMQCMTSGRCAVNRACCRERNHALNPATNVKNIHIIGCDTFKFNVLKLNSQKIRRFKGF